MVFLRAFLLSYLGQRPNGISSMALEFHVIDSLFVTVNFFDTANDTI